MPSQEPSQDAYEIVVYAGVGVLSGGDTIPVSDGRVRTRAECHPPPGSREPIVRYCEQQGSDGARRGLLVCAGSQRLGYSVRVTGGGCGQ